MTDLSALSPEQLEQQLKERKNLDEMGPYVFHKDKSLDVKAQLAISTEESCSLVFGFAAATKVMELASKILVPQLRAKHDPAGTASSFALDGDDRLLRANVMLTLLKEGIRFS